MNVDLDMNGHSIINFPYKSIYECVFLTNGMLVMNFKTLPLIHYIRTGDIIVLMNMITGGNLVNGNYKTYTKKSIKVTKLINYINSIKNTFPEIKI